MSQLQLFEPSSLNHINLRSNQIIHNSNRIASSQLIPISPLAVTGAFGWRWAMSKFITTKRNGACEVSAISLANADDNRNTCAMTYGWTRIGQLENGYKCIGNKK